MIEKKDLPVLRWKNSASFYASPSWMNLRLFKLSQDPFCERCKKKGILTPATDVHHKIEVLKDPSLALDINNLESLCSDCHKSHTMKENQKVKQAGGIVTKYKL